jgi:hypothetical protein
MRIIFANRGLSILLAVIISELALSAGYYIERWQKVLAPRDDPRIRAGEGLVVCSDGLGYYAWLRSLLIDHDWSFENEFDEHNPLGHYVPPAQFQTELGLRKNAWSVGPACVWSLTVVPGHVVMRALESLGWSRWQADGYSLPYQLLVAATTVVVSIAGLGCLYHACRTVAGPQQSGLSVALLVLGTTIVYYSVIEVSMAHGLGTATTCAVVSVWMVNYGLPSNRRWFLVGLMIGLAALMRWQLATLITLPAGEWLLMLWRNRKGTWKGQARHFVRPAFVAIGILLGFLPQMLAWRCVYGHWLTSPIPTAHNWFHPSWWRVLFSTDRSLFYWTPLTLVAVAACLSVVRRSDERLLLLLGAFLLQVYAMAALFGQNLYLGAAYGFRQLTESLVLLAPGLALFLGRLPRRRYCWILAAGLSLVAWNLVLISELRYGYVPADQGPDLSSLLAGAVQLLARKRWLLLEQVALAPVLLFVVSYPWATKTRQSKPELKQEPRLAA